jgi:hypothetical protein
MGEADLHILWTILIGIVIVNALALALVALRGFNRRAHRH